MILTLAFARCSQDDTWNLHGLWPDFSNGSWPSYCYDSTCDILDNILPETDPRPYYPPCWQADDLICHEWLKHGTCWSDSEDPNDYFGSTIDMYEKYLDYIPENDNQLNYYIKNISIL